MKRRATFVTRVMSTAQRMMDQSALSKLPLSRQKFGRFVHSTVRQVEPSIRWAYEKVKDQAVNFGVPVGQLESRVQKTYSKTRSRLQKAMKQWPLRSSKKPKKARTSMSKTSTRARSKRTSRPS